LDFDRADRAQGLSHNPFRSIKLALTHALQMRKIPLSREGFRTTVALKLRGGEDDG
jgi:hypothetical protein